MTFDITSLLLGSGFATFIALLAWGDQMRKPRVEVTELEEKFRKEYKIDKSVTNPIIRKSYASVKDSGQYSFKQQVSAVVSLLDNANFHGRDLKLLNRFRSLHRMRQSIENHYRFRYFATICFCLVLVVCGMISLFFPGISDSASSDTTAVSVLLAPIVIGIIILIANLIMTYVREELFITEISRMDDNIEAKK